MACPPAGRPQLNKAPIQVADPDIGRSCLVRNAVVLQFRREFRLVVIAYPDRIMIEARGVRGECRRYNEIAITHFEEEGFTGRQVRSGSESRIPQKRRVEQIRIKLCRLGDVRYPEIDMVERRWLQHPRFCRVGPPHHRHCAQQHERLATRDQARTYCLGQVHRQFLSGRSSVVGRSRQSSCGKTLPPFAYLDCAHFAGCLK